MGDEATEGTPPILVLWDDGHRALWALPVEHKGPTEQAVTWIIRTIEEAGYAGVGLTLKSDQEPSILALKRAGRYDDKYAPLQWSRQSETHSQTERLKGRSEVGNRSVVL